jgi:serine phosphatase RsbU (regulator of sigma subunit)
MSRLRCYLFVLICVLSGSLFSQDHYSDSLTKLYRTSQADTLKINLLRQLAAHAHGAGNYEEAIRYYSTLANLYAESHPHDALDARNEMAFEFIFLEDYEKADSILNDVLRESKKSNYTNGTGFAYRYLGLMQVYLGEYKKATDYYLLALAIWEKTNNPKRIAMGNSDLGINFYYQENYEKAAYYWEIALRISPDKNSDYYINTCSNLGQAYVELAKYDKAIAYFKKALDFHSKNRNSTNYTNALTGMANVEYKRKNYSKAIDYYQEIIRLREGGNTRSNDLATTYLNVSLIYLDIGNNKEALEYALKGYEKARESDDKNELQHAYNNLNSVYAKMGNYERAYEFSQMYNALRDSMADLESKKQINELDKKYQTEKKEKDNQLLNKQLEIKQIEGRQQRLYLIVAVVVLIFIGFLAAILYRQNKQKQEANLQLSEKSRIIEDQHKDITDSIKYAERIQHAILPPEKMWFDLLPDSFVLYKPKDILSGDFYWVEQRQDTILVAAADCTGHGVPGALMSVVNTNLLNKAVLEQNMLNPSSILDAVNQWLTIALHQTFNESAVRDGMDIALCSIDVKTKQLSFAGAFNGAYIFKNDGSFVELTGDKMPVGAFIEDKVRLFTGTQLSLGSGDRIYIFSDGYADQFGGPKGKKLKYTKLKQYIDESRHMSMAGQKQYLDSRFEEWRGNYEQVDDVLVVGICI